MMLRPRQAQMVERSLAALREHGNTLGVAPTGAGKTIILSAVGGRLLIDRDAKICVLQHRDELTAQNRSKFVRVNDGVTTSVVDASIKSWDGNAVFAMVPTLAREANLDQMPAVDGLIVDEAHHAAAPGYRRIIERVLQRNPRAAIFGVTATPNRADGQGLREVFSNVADQITVGELISSGHLVRPRSFVVDVGTTDDLSRVRKTASDFDMTEVAKVMDKTVVTEAVIRHWKDKAGDRKTIVFCSTVAHAEHVCDGFVQAGVNAVLIHGELPDGERKARLAAYERGDAQVVVNVAVLTEGYDYTPTSCIVLLRPSSHRSTLIQMIGRGLRVVDPAEFPGVIKTDCIVLDFGTATLQHGSLEQDIDLDGVGGDGDAPTKSCPQCEALVPLGCRECPLCGHVWPPRESGPDGVLTDFGMTEIDVLLRRSNFQWCDLHGDGAALMATGFNAWAGVFFLDGRWHAVGGGNGLATGLLGIGERSVCLAQADDFINGRESADAAHKTRRWLQEAPTPKQLAYLPPELRADMSLTRYQASALLQFRFNRSDIRRLVMAANDSHREAA